MSSSPTNSQHSAGERLGPWQEKLLEYCRASGMRTPVYTVASDRRGGRTAWSCTVEVNGQTVPARYWYSGDYVHNAKEDAASVALERLQYQHQQMQQQQQQQQHRQPYQTYQAWPSSSSR